MESSTQPAGLPHKVTLEITAEGWRWSVLDKDNVLIGSREMRRVKGGFRGTEKAEVFEKALFDYPLVLEAIEGDDIYEVARQLEFLLDED